MTLREVEIHLRHSIRLAEMQRAESEPSPWGD
jgi:hypothetical protein